ncbi:hypothetical protein JB92DRAFT_2800660 [Gautieria morchelliformis]|nr:hypothetical protein JB92DRAFT_2800660 [Gautieria morchelliformis]
MPNIAGKNQYGDKLYPPDNELRAEFDQYTRESLPAPDQLARLEAKFGLKIKRSVLYQLRKWLSNSTVRKNELDELDMSQAVINVKENDIMGLWGVGQVKQRLAEQGIHISRHECRKILHDHFNEEFEYRFAESRKIKRKPLLAVGPFHKFHWDGHEKLGGQALGMGPIGLPIYGGKDEWSSYLVKLVVMPSVWLARAIAHVKLDVIEEMDNRIAITDVTDMGTETGEMLHIQETLRMDAAPQFSLEKWPSGMRLRSVHNMPIESFWRWKRNGEGHSIHHVLSLGCDRGIFHPNDGIHIDAFNWLWPPLVQDRLDRFRDYWNSHHIPYQKGKPNASRTSPRNTLLVPTSVSTTARDCSIHVCPELVDHLREAYGGDEGHEAAFWFVSCEFQAEADNTWLALRRPS